MDHLDLQLAHRLLRGSLPPADQQYWTEHLRTCDRCRALIDSERSLRAVLHLGDAAPQDPEAASLRDLVQQVDRLSHAPVAGGRWRLAIRVGCCAALLATLVWQALHPHGLHQPAGHKDPRSVPQAASHLPSLQALERDPWLQEDYETVLTLERLFSEVPQ